MLLKTVKKYYHRLLSSHATTEEVAQGFALGVFIGVTPSMGLHTVLALVLAAFFGKNKIAAVLGTWINNPLTIFPIFYYDYRVGVLFLHEHRVRALQPESLKDLFHLSRSVLVPMWVGSVILGLVLAVLSFYLVRFGYPVLKKRFYRISHSPNVIPLHDKKRKDHV